jgi:hypothetical protein
MIRESRSVREGTKFCSKKISGLRDIRVMRTKSVLHLIVGEEGKIGIVCASPIARDASKRGGPSGSKELDPSISEMLSRVEDNEVM